MLRTSSTAGRGRRMALVMSAAIWRREKKGGNQDVFIRGQPPNKPGNETPPLNSLRWADCNEPRMSVVNGRNAPSSAPSDRWGSDRNLEFFHKSHGFDWSVGRKSQQEACTQYTTKLRCSVDSNSGLHGNFGGYR